MIAIRAPHDNPAILANRGARSTAALCKAYERGELDFTFETKIYGSPSVKKLLSTVQHHKCCYCEAKYFHTSYGDIDHYRPKAGSRQSEAEQELTPGYYWLAYEISNLLSTCERCNRSHKRTYFPLRNPADRARNHRDDIAREQPLIINPRQIDPTIHIGFRDEYPFPINASPLGIATIKYAGLDREPLNEDRREHLETIRALWTISKLGLPESLDARHKLNQLCEPGAEYSAASRAHRTLLDGSAGVGLI